MRVSLHISRGTGFEGGHLETEGLSPTGDAIGVPTYRHAIGLDFVRYELMASRRLSDAWDLRLRMPYDVKDRSARVELVDPATGDEQAAMERQLDLHHPSRTLAGFSDFSLVLARKREDTLRPGDTFVLAFGTSVPVGRIEDNPFALGEDGLAHEHIQFGTGTFDPLLELHYAAPVSESMVASANALARCPLYENRRGYRGPAEVTSNLALTLMPTDRLRLRAGLSFGYQGHARWDGERDTNSGLLSHAAVAGASYRRSDGGLLTIDLRVPIEQRTLAEEGDTFEQGPIVQVGLVYSF